jgi:D-alanine transaminase
MDRSLKNLHLRNPFKGGLKDIGEKLLQDNRLQDTDATFYVQVTRGAAPRQFAFPGEYVSPTVYAAVSAFEPAPNQHKRDKGVKVVIEPDIRWGRCDIKTIGLLPGVLASQRAKEQQAEEAVLVRDGVITECSHTSFGAIFGNQFFAYPESNNILPGITLQVVLEICSNLGISVIRTPVPVDQIKEADELILMGTTMEVVPIVQVDDWKVGDGSPGPIAKKLQREYSKLTLK